MASLCSCEHPAIEGRLPEIPWRCTQCLASVPKDEILQDPSVFSDTRRKLIRRSSLNLSWPKYMVYSGDEGTSQHVASVLKSDEYIADHTALDSGLSNPECPSEEQQIQAAHPITHQYYKYKSLETNSSTGETSHIRIFQLSSGGREDPLHGKLLVKVLNGLLRYEAVSYTWADETGDKGRHRPLYLENSWYRLPITKSCEAMLRRFRHETGTRDLWVDSICINQEDPQERRQQVGLMPEIYSRAQKALVYLGAGSKRISDAIFALNADKQSSQVYAADYYYIRAIKELFSLPYFSRVWIIQELALAKEVAFYHGYDLQSFGLDHSLEKITDMLRIASARDVIPLWLRHCGQPKLNSWREAGSLIFDGISNEASKPEDKIFGFLGMMSGASAEGLTADYDLTVEQVYTGIATFLMSKGHLLGLLKRANCRGSRLAKYNNEPLDLPSWVPDFRQAASIGNCYLNRDFCPIYIQSNPDNSQALSTPEAVLRLTGSLVIHGYRILRGIEVIESQLDYVYVHDSGFKIWVRFQEFFKSNMDIIMLPCNSNLEPYALHLRKTGIRNSDNCYIYVGLCQVGLPRSYSSQDGKIALQPEYFPITQKNNSGVVRSMDEFLGQNPHLEITFDAWRLWFSRKEEDSPSSESAQVWQAIGLDPCQDRIRRLARLLPARKVNVPQSFGETVSPTPRRLMRHMPSNYDELWYQWPQAFDAVTSAARIYVTKGLDSPRELHQKLLTDLREKIEPWKKATLRMIDELDWELDYGAFLGGLYPFRPFRDISDIRYPTRRDLRDLGLSSVDDATALFDAIHWNIEIPLRAYLARVYYAERKSEDGRTSHPVRTGIEYLIGNWGEFIKLLSLFPRGHTVTDSVERILEKISRCSDSDVRYPPFILGSYEKFVII
ncbi:hypothetical protein Daesc_001827 [Daldinia eschscholtzii]|uniref:Heterokaryon incompatibility domain-containing protein n=1 Tax=Daldinia eschscholtzii TaxID=292717 RepID=A0AAX6MVA2_9PEZI